MNTNKHESVDMKKLLEGVDVEWKALGEVVVLKRGTRLIKSQLEESGSYAVYQNCMTPLGYYHECNVKLATTFIISAGAAGEIGYSEVDFWAADDVYYFVTPHDLDSKFLYYFLLTQQSRILSQVRRASIPRLSRTVVERLQIPIPPLSIQKEIVRILDTFTELNTELNTELTNRKKQYNHYRDQLLSFDDGDVEWKTLGEVGELVRGNGLPKTDFTEFGIPAIHYGQIYTYYGLSTATTKSFVAPVTAEKLRKVNYGDVVITNTSENLEDVGKALVYLGEEQAVFGGHATVFKPFDIIIGKYLAYYTQTKTFTTVKRQYSKGTKVIDVSATDLAKIKIPIPPLAEQARIVAILDKFDTLTHSISEGLPREIALRQKQYEYYRNLLLNFPKQRQS